MEYRNLGRTGVKVSPLCFGTDCFADPVPEKESAKLLDAAVDAGINLIDTGDSYAEGEGEKIIGRTLKASGTRHKVLLATKCDHGQRRPGLTLDEFVPDMPPNTNGASRINIVRAVEESLRRFQTDHIDLYQIHRQDLEVNIDETLSALTDLVRMGKIRYIGCSTHPAWAVMEAILIAEFKNYVRFSVEQPPYNLLDRRIENELIPMAQKYEMGIITWSPLAMGVLVGAYTEEKNFPPDSRAALRGGFYADRVTKKGIEVGEKFVKLAKDTGLTPGQLGVLWCKDQPGITAPLIGPEKMEHLVDLLPVLEMTLSDELREACDNLVPPGSSVANFHNTSDWFKGQII